MMSMADLDRIHSQLKDAIKAHQLLVAQMKTDSEHGDVQQTLHKLQSEIRTLSEQQKLVVHQLRQEILTLQSSSSQQEMNSAGNPLPACIEGFDTMSNSDIPVKDETVVMEETVMTIDDIKVDFPALCQVVASEACLSSRYNDSYVTNNIAENLKSDFMSRLALITPDSLKEFQSKRTELKRRNIGANNLCYGQFEPEGQNELREDYCSVCRRSGELLMCDVCSLVYHLQCLDPPLLSVPFGLWSCPKCQALSKLCGGKDDWPGTLALVHSYLTHKAAREDEKYKMKKVNEQLTNERLLLEHRSTQLVDLISVATIQQRNQRRVELMETRSKAQQLYENLQKFVIMCKAQ